MRVGVFGRGVAVRTGVRVLAGTCIGGRGVFGGRGGRGVFVGPRGGGLAVPTPYVAANQSQAILDSVAPNEYPVDSLDAFCERYVMT